MTNEEFDAIKVGDVLWDRGVLGNPEAVRVTSRTANRIVAAEDGLPFERAYNRSELVGRSLPRACLTRAAMLDAMILRERDEIARLERSLVAVREDLAELLKLRESADA